MIESTKGLFVKVQSLQLILVRQATGKVEEGDSEAYQELRQELVQNPQISEGLPSFVQSCRNLNDFWSFIQPKFSTYASRRAYLQDEFESLLNYLEFEGVTSHRNQSRSFEVGNFDRQFPAGLPFGLKKPQVRMVSESGEMKAHFEEENGIGVLKGNVYPDLTYHSLCEIVSAIDKTNSLQVLVDMCQTEYEKQFLHAYAEEYNMINASIPVLIPQAWIQWHSLTKRDLRALNSDYTDELYRVDFVAFWGNRRFAILIDDISHYARKNYSYWNADQKKYSQRLKEDRKLRKEKWNVFRLSNWEIRENQGYIHEILCDLKEFMEFEPDEPK